MFKCKKSINFVQGRQVYIETHGAGGTFEKIKNTPTIIIQDVFQFL